MYVFVYVFQIFFSGLTILVCRSNFLKLPIFSRNKFWKNFLLKRCGTRFQNDSNSLNIFTILPSVVTFAHSLDYVEWVRVGQICGLKKKIADIREGNQETLGLRSNVFENLQMYFYKQIDWCKFDFLLLFLTSFLSSTNKVASKPRNYFIAPSISRYSTYRVGSKFLIFMPFFSIFRPFF